MEQIRNNLTNIYLKLSRVLSPTTVSVQDQTFLIKRLSFLISAHIPVIESLYMLREQTRSKKQLYILDRVIHDVSHGQYISSSLSQFRGVFSEFAINIIRVGETTGTLAENLTYLAHELQKKQILRRKIVSAFIYPVIVISATAAITLFLIIYLFPKIMPVFRSLHIALPLSTRIVMRISDAMRHDGTIILIVLTIMFVSFLVILKKSSRTRFSVDRLMCHLPVIGKVVRSYNLANCTRTLGLLLKSGVPLSDSLPTVVETTKNVVYKYEFTILQTVVNRGEKMSVYLKTRLGLFPDITSHIIAVGERSGNLAQSLTYLSDLYEGEVDEFTKNLSTLIEPLLMIFMGLLIGFIAVSIITPIYAITQNLHP